MWLTIVKYDFFICCIDWLIAQLGGLDWLMLVLPFVMDADSIFICGWQYSFSSLHFLHCWFSFCCFFRHTQMFNPHFVNFGHLSWVDSLPFEVEKSHPVPIPWTVYLNLLVFSIQIFCQLFLINHFILELLFFKKHHSTKHLFNSPSVQYSVFLLS